MIKKLVEKMFWKYHAPLGDIDRTDKEDIDVFFIELAGHDSYSDICTMLKAFMREDKEKYFKSANDHERDILKGSYLRSLYIYTNMVKARSKEEDTAKEKKGLKKIVLGGRYG